jgi:hypothetical protein
MALERLTLVHLKDLDGTQGIAEEVRAWLPNCIVDAW